MFHKILVAMDFSGIGKYVFDEALSLAKPLKANLMLVHVLSAEEEGCPSMSSFGYYPGVSEVPQEFNREQWDAFEKRGLELLRSRTDEATAAGVNTEFTQTSGSPGRKICNLAKTWGADSIVIGRRGRSGLSELLLGSVSNYVLHHAPCSVLVVQGMTPTTATTTQVNARRATTH